MENSVLEQILSEIEKIIQLNNLNNAFKEQIQLNEAGITGKTEFAVSSIEKMLMNQPELIEQFLTARSPGGRSFRWKIATRIVSNLPLTKEESIVVFNPDDTGDNKRSIFSQEVWNFLQKFFLQFGILATLSLPIEESKREMTRLEINLSY